MTKEELGKIKCKLELNRHYRPDMELTIVKLQDLVEYLGKHPQARVVGL